MVTESKARESIVAAGLEMNRSGINQGTSGNISLNWDEGLLITPRSLPYNRMTAEDASGSETVVADVGFHTETSSGHGSSRRRAYTPERCRVPAHVKADAAIP